MTQAESSPVADLINHTAVDSDGNQIGTVSDVYLDNETNQPEWLAVTTGQFGSEVSFVPIAGASLVDDNVMVGYAKSQIEDAPRTDADGELSPEDEDALYTHYGTEPLSGTTGVQTTDDRVGDGQGYDTSGAETDDAMTRSEEQVDVSTGTRQAGTARLRKWIETEDVQMTVPISREKARMVTEPITDANRDAATSGGDLTEEEHEVTLTEEVVDVDKRVVPKERVRLETDVETEEVTVDEQVRKERIEMDDDNSGTSTS
jgi:uncharacterized protein (TIGR02271 family)